MVISIRHFEVDGMWVSSRGSFDLRTHLHVSATSSGASYIL